MMKRKYEPLNVTEIGLNSKAKPKSKSKNTTRAKARRASKIDKRKNDLRIDQLNPRKVFTSTGWQRTAKSAECPKNKIATEEYYRALKSYKEISAKEKQLEMQNNKALSILLAG